MSDIENHLASLTEAYEKGLTTETFKIIARAKLVEVAKEQWELPDNPWLSSSDEASVIDSTEVVTKKRSGGKPKKPRTESTPLDKEDFARRFLNDPASIKKAELVKAACKNGWNVAQSFPALPVAEGEQRVAGNKVIKMKSEELAQALREAVPELRTLAITQ